MTTAHYPTPEAAEAAFYEAFERKDLEAMMQVWSEDEHIECIHPMGARLRGVRAVRESWRRIFADGLQMRFSIRDAHYSQGNLLAIHVVHENIITDAHSAPHPPVIATNIYQCTAHGWRMILHHASPSPALTDGRAGTYDGQQMH